MATRSTKFILGARDPEMDYIEAVLRRNDYTNIEYACGADGKRCHYGSAYPSRATDGPVNEVIEDQVWIECAPKDGGKARLREKGIPFIDHHYPGDPGFDCSPREYWRGSSVGQLHEMLDIEASRAAHVVAAIDHCINAAYRGECALGDDEDDVITPDEILNMQVLSIWPDTGKPVETVRENVERWRRAISVHASTQHRTRRGIQPVHEFFSITITEFWDYLCAREAALVERVCAVFITKFDEAERDPNRKLNIVGHPSPDFIEQFLGGSALYPEVCNRYGSPTRGYGGGYVKPYRGAGILQTGSAKAMPTAVEVEYALGMSHALLRIQDLDVEIHMPSDRLGIFNKPWTCRLIDR